MNLRPLAYASLPLLLAWACGTGRDGSGQAEPDFSIPDTLRVGTLYSPTSYFIYQEEKMGVDYDLLMRFSEDKHVAVDLQVAPSLSALIAMLDSGVIDVAAYEIPNTSEFKEHIIPAGPENITTQVLVQPKNSPQGLITDVTDLVGREIYVERGSKYQHRLNNLNDELGGGILIHNVDRDTLITEDLIEMVADGQIPLTVVDSDVARLNRSYFSSLDIGMQVSFPQRSSWGVSPAKPWLADSINAWMEGAEPRNTQARLLKRYFERAKAVPTYHVDFRKGRISPYDDIFRRYGKSSGIDWRLLAAQGYAESRFDSTQVSWAGAKGIMQIMPGTARAHGVSPSSLTNPEASIACAADIMKGLDKSLARYVDDPAERQKFVLAAYNSGIAHIYDAIALARKYGKDPQIWTGNVADALLLKANPEYYNDPVCKYGYFRGKETTAYVRKVLDFYEQSKRHIKE